MTEAVLNLFSSYVKKKYGTRVQKISVDAGFSCPNRDGTKGVGGCTFCNNDSFSMGDRKFSIEEQVRKSIVSYRRRYPKLEKYIVYFQSYSNTYSDVHALEKLYREALAIPGVVGLSIGTRPDCIDEEKILMLEKLARGHDISLEYGIETFSEESLVRINRGHGVREFEQALELSRGRGMMLGTHLIIGFPWETEADLERSCQHLKNLPLDFIKFHQLQIVKGTAMANEYQRRAFKLQEKEEYFQKLGKLISFLPKNVLIQRLFSDYRDEFLVSPSWGSLSQLRTEFMQYLSRQGIFQGKNLAPQTTY